MKSPDTMIFVDSSHSGFLWQMCFVVRRCMNCPKEMSIRNDSCPSDSCPNGLHNVLLPIVRCNIRRWEVSLTITDLTLPPILVCTIRDGNDVTTPEFQFTRFLWWEIVDRLNQKFLWLHVRQFDVLWPADRCWSMILYQLVQGIEFHDPEEKFPRRITQHFKVLNTVTTSKVNNR